MNRIVRNALVAIVALGPTGCGWYLQQLTSLKIECAAHDIAVSNDRVEAPRRKWDARCATGGVYACSLLQSGQAAIVTCEDASPRAIRVQR